MVETKKSYSTCVLPNLWRRSHNYIHWNSRHPGHKFGMRIYSERWHWTTTHSYSYRSMKNTSLRFQIFHIWLLTIDRLVWKKFILHLMRLFLFCRIIFLLKQKYPKTLHTLKIIFLFEFWNLLKSVSFSSVLLSTHNLCMSLVFNITRAFEASQKPTYAYTWFCYHDSEKKRWALIDLKIPHQIYVQMKLRFYKNLGKFVLRL